MKIIRLQETTSTNTVLRQMAERGEGLEHGMVLAAEFQTDGRGQMNNHWEAERGKNLLFSMLLLPKSMLAAAQFPISEAVALGVCDFLNSKAEGFKVKWPNDIYWQDKKIAGILIENLLAGNYVTQSVAGIGLNINQEEFLSDAPNPVSLKNITGQNYDLDEALEQVCSGILKRFSQAEASPATLHEDYKKLLYRLGEAATYSDDSGIFEGTITDVAPNGMLQVQKADGTVREYAFKEVSFVFRQ